MLTFLAGAVAGISVVGLLVIVLTPSRRVRAEAKLDREVETRILLGDAPDLDADAQDASIESIRSDFGAAELQALRQLGSERTASSRRRGNDARRR